MNKALFFIGFLLLDVALLAQQANISGGVYRSSDQGLTWENISAGLPADLRVEYVATENKSIFLGTANGGIYDSGKKNISWAKVGGIPVLSNEKITGLFPTDEGLYASVFGSGCFQKYFGNGVWIPVPTVLKDNTIRAVLKQNETFFAGADDGIFKSMDGGKSWKQVFSEGQVTSLVSSNGVLIGGAFRGVLRSTDGGEHWTWILEDGMVHRAVVIDDQFVLMGETGILRASADGGNTWRRIDNELPPGKPIYDLEKVKAYLVCSHDDGIYRSADWGQHWELLLETPAAKFLDLTVADGIIYGGTVRR